MAQIKVCDICKKQIDSENFDGYRVKQNRTFRHPQYHCWYRAWGEIDLCESCLKLIANMCNDHEFIKYVVNEWEKKKANK